MTKEKAISIIKNAFSWYEDNARESEDEDWSGQHEALRMAIKALAQRWIPVSEKLPDDGAVVFYTDNKGETGMICYWEELPREFEDIIAWMPLPEPYKEGEADDE